MYKWPILFDSKLFFFVIRNYTDVTAAGGGGGCGGGRGGVSSSIKPPQKIHIEIFKWVARERWRSRVTPLVCHWLRFLTERREAGARVSRADIWVKRLMRFN